MTRVIVTAVAGRTVLLSRKVVIGTLAGQIPTKEVEDSDTLRQLERMGDIVISDVPAVATSTTTTQTASVAAATVSSGGSATIGSN